MATFYRLSTDDGSINYNSEEEALAEYEAVTDDPDFYGTTWARLQRVQTTTLQEWEE